MKQSYDSLSRMKQVQVADGSVTNWGYSGLQEIKTIPCNQGSGGLNCNRTVTEVKNAAGELVQSIDANGFAVNYERDALGQLRKAKRTVAGQTIISEVIYDSLDRKSSMIDPDRGTWSYRYNAAGEQIATVDSEKPADI
ncbi:hypothetical protein HC761_00395 [bacterium]|nr:hypothetical protein [bacterium]